MNDRLATALADRYRIERELGAVRDPARIGEAMSQLTRITATRS